MHHGQSGLIDKLVSAEFRLDSGSAAACAYVPDLVVTAMLASLELYVSATLCYAMLTASCLPRVSTVTLLTSSDMLLC